MENRWKRELRSLSTPILFSAAVAFIFQSWEIAVMLTASLGFHELGHIIAIWTRGIDWELGFGAIGAWTRSSLEQRRVLGHYANSLIHLAGPCFSFLFALAALGMFFLMKASVNRVYWLLLANLNALLALLNIMPMGKLSDGGKFVRRLFASLPEREERQMLLTFLPSLVSWIALLNGMDLARAASLGTIVLWLAISVLVESTQDDPTEAESPRAMTRQQAGVLASAMFMLFFLSVCIVVITPFWLTERAVLRMAEGLISLAVGVIWRGPIGLRVGLIALGCFAVVGLVRWVVVRMRPRRT